MPSYDLSCGACGHAFEVFRQGFLRDEDRICPACASTRVEQLFTGFITARPARAAAPAPVPVGGGGGCGSSCGCGGH